jgi:hypothetical protein
MILVSQSYVADTEDRNRELQACRENNENSGVFSRVEYLDGTRQRLTFNELVEHCNRKYRGTLCVVANSDITFGSSVYSLVGLKKPNRLIALTRWETVSSPRFLGWMRDESFYSGSQDSWAFVAGEIPKLSAEIPLGIVGCDSVIAGWGVLSGMELINPCLTIRTMHVHAKPVERSESDPALGGFFGYPEATTLNTTGRVLCHHWPSEDGTWEFKWQLCHTKK